MPDRPGPRGHSTGGPGDHRWPVHFGVRVVLSKEETFDACQALADAGRVLVRSGGFTEADMLGSLFELLEERLVAVDAGGDCPRGADPPPTCRVGGGSSGR